MYEVSNIQINPTQCGYEVTWTERGHPRRTVCLHTTAVAARVNGLVSRLKELP